MMYKCMEKGENQYAALLELRNTPRQDTGLSPTQMMYGRFTRSRIPAITSKPVSRARMTVANRHRQNRRKAVKRSYDKQARDLVPIRVGHPVFYRHTPERPWKKGRVRSRDGEREYTIEGDNGGVYQRNRRFLRPTQIFNPEQQTPTPTPTPNPKTPMTHYPTPTPCQPFKATPEDEWLAPAQTDEDEERDVPALPLPSPGIPGSTPPMARFRPQHTVATRSAPSPETRRSPATPTTQPQRNCRRPGWMEDYDITWGADEYKGE
ncbi:hypothetical protein ACOMHN_054405 [Nucella lapillus]